MTQRKVIFEARKEGAGLGCKAGSSGGKDNQRVLFTLLPVHRLVAYVENGELGRANTHQSEVEECSSLTFRCVPHSCMLRRLHPGERLRSQVSPCKRGRSSKRVAISIRGRMETVSLQSADDWKISSSELLGRAATWSMRSGEITTVASSSVLAFRWIGLQPLRKTQSCNVSQV